MALTRTTVIREEVAAPRHATTAAEARQRGLYLSLTGTPCKRGHICCRYTATYQCVRCASEDRVRYRKKVQQKRQQAPQPTIALPAAHQSPKTTEPTLGLLEAFHRYLIRKL